MRFSQRIGLVAAGKLAQRESIDDELRSSLWSLLSLIYWESYTPPRDHSYLHSPYVKGSNLYPLMIKLWLSYFKRPTDTIDEPWENCLDRLRRYFFSAAWYMAYDFIEFIAQNGPEEKNTKFIQEANIFLERENSAYRFVDDQICEITSAEEIDEVEAALAATDRFTGVRMHIKSALALLSDRKNPDYRNSIKESISAVEALAKKIATDDSATLGAILRDLERSKKLHPALKNAFSALYGYTSDAQGIRHALLDEPTLTKSDARFMLVCCSAFINFVIEGTSV